MLHEGASQSAIGSATDAAGNASSTSVGPISIDTTLPMITGTPTTAPNGAGWYNSDVTIHWSASDALSGLNGVVPSDSVLTADGTNVCASASVTDIAGNSASATTCVKIDRTGASTTAELSADFGTGWWAGSAQLTLVAVDNLSGVAATYYAVDDGPAAAYFAPFAFTTGGVHTITFWSVDGAGNVEDRNGPGHTVTVKIDDVAPHIMATRSPAANEDGWNNGDVTVSFTCSDDETAVATCPVPVVVSAEQAGQTVSGSAVDAAGNTATATVTAINVDKTAPTIAGSANPSANAFGWNNSAVTVTFACSDSLSTVRSCDAPVTLTDDTDAGTATGDSTDRAGNSASTTVSGIKIDTVPPTLDGTPATLPNEAGWYNQPVVIHWVAGDDRSGGPSRASRRLTAECASHD